MYARDYRQIAREKLSGNWAAAVAVALLAALMGGAMGTSNISFNLQINETTARLIPDFMIPALLRLSLFFSLLALAQFIIGGAVRLGNCRYLLNLQDGRESSVNDLFSQFGRFGDGFVLQLLQGLYVMLWSLLFIIPGIIAVYRYAMAPFILLEHPDMKASEAIAASSEMMHGHKWQLFCLEFSFIGWAILCVLTCGIGTLWLRPYESAAYAAFYREISR